MPDRTAQHEARLLRPVVVMGVSGSGKSTVGEALALELDVPFGEGDAMHPESNREKMAAGTPLTDEDRWPWLDVVGHWLATHPASVVSCSALRRAYRDRLREHVSAVWFLHLDGDHHLLSRQQADRKGHFMPASLMHSQLDTLEPLAPDEAGLRLDVALSVEDLVARAVADLATAAG